MLCNSSQDEFGLAGVLQFAEGYAPLTNLHQQLRSTFTPQYWHVVINAERNFGKKSINKPTTFRASDRSF
jgi:hypothetical protein